MSNIAGGIMRLRRSGLTINQETYKVYSVGPSNDNRHNGLNYIPALGRITMRGKEDTLRCDRKKVFDYLFVNRGSVVHSATMASEIFPALSSDEAIKRIYDLVCRLRKTVEPDPSTPRHIITERMMGYKLVM